MIREQQFPIFCNFNRTITRFIKNEQFNKKNDYLKNFVNLNNPLLKRYLISKNLSNKFIINNYNFLKNVNYTNIFPNYDKPKKIELDL